MPILELKDFCELKQHGKAIVALDLGEKVIGVSVSDSRWVIASPLQNITNKKFTSSAEEIFKIIDERNAIGLVIGLPMSMDGTDNKKCQSAKQFGRNLMKLRDINIHFFDERFSTIQAQQTLDNSDMSWDKKQGLIDKVAASHILQNFLERV